MFVGQLAHLFGVLGLESLELATLVELQLAAKFLQSRCRRLVGSSSFPLHLKAYHLLLA